MGRENATETYRTNGLRALCVQIWGGVACQRAADIRIKLTSDLLVKMDMATMAHSIEALSPLLDHKLAEVVSSIPGRYLCNGFRTKALLRDAYKGFLPTEIINAPKKGFEVPMESLPQKELRPLLFDTVAQPNAVICSYLSHNFLTDLVHGNILGDRNKPYIIYSLLVLELWLRQFKQSRQKAST